MDAKEYQRNEVVRKAREALARKDGPEALRLTAQAESLQAEIEHDRSIKAAFNAAAGGVGPDTEGVTTARKTGADLLPLRFSRKDIEMAAKAVSHGQPYGMKAVQTEIGLTGGMSLMDLSPVEAERDRFRLSSLLSAAPSMGDGNTVTHYAPTTLAIAADATAESATPGQSSPEWDPVEEPIRKIAHYSHIPVEALQDFSQLQNALMREMGEGLIGRENQQLLLGSGVSPNLAGIFDDSRSPNTNSQGADTELDAILRAISEVNSATFREADAIVMSAATWLRIRTLKDGEDRYQVGPATGPGIRSIDGVPVHLSAAATALHVYVGDFASAKLYVREAPVVLFSGQDGDDFRDGKCKFLARERLALAVSHSQAFVDLTLNA